MDYEYQDGDYVLEDGQAKRSAGARWKCARLVRSSFRMLGGIPFGNKMWTELRRAPDTPPNRRRAANYCKECLTPLAELGTGEISDLSSEVVNPMNKQGSGIRISFKDVATGARPTLDVAPPWGVS